MAEELPEIRQTSLATLPESFKQLMKIVSGVNQLRQFPLTAIEIAEWSNSLHKGIPNLDLDALDFLITEMKFGRFEWDKTTGIQNLTLGLPRVEKTKDGYRIKSSASPW